MKIFQIIICVFILVHISSCDFPEHYFTPEPACQTNTTNDLEKENQKILVEKLKDKKPNDFRYFFKTFKEEGNQTFMITNFRNDESCFDIKILVENWDKLAGMKRTNGKAYPKELYDLNWKIKLNNGEEVVQYIDMHRIID